MPEAQEPSPEIVIRSSFSPDRSNREDQVAKLVLFLQSAAFTYEQAGFGLNCT